MAYQRVEVNQQSLNDQTLAVLVGISKEKGVDLVMTFEHSVNKEKFKEFITKLREKYQDDNLCLYFDNLAVHRSKEVRDHLNQNLIPYVFCPPYSPDFNGIENVFSIYKNKLKRERLADLVNGK